MQFAPVDYWIIALSLVLMASSLALFFIKDLIHAVIVNGAYTVVMDVIWLLMNTPDLAITEAAAGICTTVLMMIAIYRTTRKEE